MIIDISKVIAEKMEQMQKDRVIEAKIEETLEKTILDTISSELSSWEFRRTISDEVKKSIGDVASELGLGAYNAFIAKKVKDIVAGMYEADMAEKVAETLSNTLLKKYDEVKLSEIFDKYREWLFDYVDESEKHERQHFCCVLDVRESGCFTHYEITLGEEERNHPSDNKDIFFKICQYNNDKSNINSLWLDGDRMENATRIGYLTDFEAFLLNLYYNKTPIILDVDDVDTCSAYDIDI